MKVLVDKYWDKLACEFALNEGGAALVEDGKVKYMGVGAAEKLPRAIILRATGSSGHGSVPRPDNSVNIVGSRGESRNVANLGAAERGHARVLCRLASISQPEEAAWYRNIEDPAVQEQLRLKQPVYYSDAADFRCPDHAESGHQINVIPPTAEATLDVPGLCRMRIWQRCGGSLWPS